MSRRTTGPVFGRSARLRHWDPVFFLAPLLLNAAGLYLIAVTAPRALPAQAVFTAAGIALFTAVSLLGHGLFVRFSRPLYGLFVLLLLATLFFAPVIAGSRAWLVLGPVHLQPAEWMKPVLALALAELYMRPPAKLVKILLLGIVPLGLVLAQPDLGTAVALGTVLAVTLYFQRISLRMVVTVALLAAFLFLFAWLFLFKPYQKQRILTFLFPSYATSHSGYQAKQSLIAVGSGRLTGKGMALSTQTQLRFLPAQHTDFIFATLAERRGFLGAAFVLGLFALLILRMTAAGRASPEPDARMLAYMLAGFFSFHVMYNIAMVLALVPITGIPLPFLSYGGSFLTACWFSAGLLNSLAARRYGQYES
jgi:rod shape determining protein RodA